jgi:stress response protein YsnF
MKYISHVTYKSLMSRFQKETPKGILKEALDPVGKEDSDIDNDGDVDKTDKYLANRRKAIGKAVGKGRMMKEGDDMFLDAVFDILNDEMRSNQISEKEFNNAVKYLDKHGAKLSQTGHEPKAVADAIIKKVSGIEEYSYTDNYPGSWGYREGKEGDVVEGLHMPPLQATGQTVVTNEDQAPYGFSVLSPDERKQLKEYIESIKTIKKEIAKLTAKAGKKVKNEGGDMTGLTMTPSVTSEGASHEEIEKIESKIPEKLYTAAERVIEELRKAGLNDGEIKMFLDHEIEEKGKEAVMSQHDV